MKWNRWNNLKGPDAAEFEELYKYVVELMIKTGKRNFVIDCKADTGLTGTFLMYMALKMMKGSASIEDYIEIFCWLKACRIGMGLTWEQHLFLIRAFFKNEAKKLAENVL